MYAGYKLGQERDCLLSFLEVVANAQIIKVWPKWLEKWKEGGDNDGDWWGHLPTNYYYIVSWTSLMVHRLLLCSITLSLKRYAFSNLENFFS